MAVACAHAVHIHLFRTIGIPMMNRFLLACWLLVGTSHVSVHAKPGANLVANGRFAIWEQDRPKDWIIEIGAGDQTSALVSQIRKDGDSGLVLSGDQRTQAWKLIRQDIMLKAGGTYRLSGEVHAVGIKREPHQFDNCYLGILFRDGRNQRLGLKVKDVSSINRLSKVSMTFRVPNAAESASVLVFLSKSGRLIVRHVAITVAKPLSPFDQLMTSLRSHYSFSRLKGVDWKALSNKYAQKVSQGESAEEFAKAIVPLLSELEDIHVWIEMPDGERRFVHRSMHTPTYSKSVIRGKLTGFERFESIGGIGRIREIAYVSIDGLPANADYASFINALTAVQDVDGMIIDIRRNGGGSELRAKEIAGCFTKRTVTYAQLISFREGQPSRKANRVLEAGTKQVPGFPVVCLIDGGCVSSCEGLALMFKAIDRVAVMGSNTRGASGNPKPVVLSNGVKVWFSRWVSMELDGSPVEGRGVQPQIEIAADPQGDAPLLRALAWLENHR
ncbi:MAG: S41 family peptidase [Planctomycetota bacterium]